MSLSITALQPGDEIIALQRLGLALEPTITGKGVEYLQVPTKPQMASYRDLVKWRGTVLLNNTTELVLSVMASKYNRRYDIVGTGLLADISYTALQRVYLLSPFSIPGQDQTDIVIPVYGANYKPYRIKEEVLLSW